MLESLPNPVRGCFSLAVVIVNTIFWGLLIFLVALLKLVIPLDGWRIACSRLLHHRSELGLVQQPGLAADQADPLGGCGHRRVKIGCMVPGGGQSPVLG